MKYETTKTATVKNIICLIYAASGVGKTTLASTLDHKKTLIISAESGLLSIADHDIPFVDITKKTSDGKIVNLNVISKVEKLRKIIKHLQEGTEFENIFIDSLSEVNQIFVEYYQMQFTDRKDALVLWGEVTKTMKNFIKTFRDMSQYNVFMTALEKQDKDDMQRKICLPDLNGKLAFSAPAYFDEVFFYKKVVTDEKEKRALLTDSTEQYVAKDRSGKLNQFEEPNLQTIINKIRGVKNGN